jgi:hypothetical protein
MDPNLSRLLQRFSIDLATTSPSDLDTLALAYMNLAYQLGRDAGRAEALSDRPDANTNSRPRGKDDRDTERDPERK